MSGLNNDRWENVIEYSIPTSEALEQVAKVLCERALNDAKGQLHPLLQNIELDRLDQRSEFLQAFKCGLEQQIARKLTCWYPDILAIFSFESRPTKRVEDWDGSIHLLVKVHHLTKEMEPVRKILDNNLAKCLKQFNWQRFQECQSMLDIQQFTPHELCHGTGYGGMFYAVYTVPAKIWSRDRQTG
jgi:hypothetical protein